MRTFKGMATEKTMTAVIAVAGGVFFLGIWMMFMNSQGDASGCSPVVKAIASALDEAGGFTACGG